MVWWLNASKLQRGCGREAEEAAAGMPDMITLPHVSVQPWAVLKDPTSDSTNEDRDNPSPLHTVYVEAALSGPIKAPHPYLFKGNARNSWAENRANLARGDYGSWCFREQLNASCYINDEVVKRHVETLLSSKSSKQVTRSAELAGRNDFSKRWSPMHLNRIPRYHKKLWPPTPTTAANNDSIMHTLCMISDSPTRRRSSAEAGSLKD